MSEAVDGVASAAIASTIDRWSRGRDDSATSIAGLDLFRRERPSEPKLCLIEPSVVVAVQGAKQLLLGEHAYRYDASKFLVASLDVPANSQVLEASPARPCLGFVLKLDLRLVLELVAQGEAPPPVRSAAASVAIGVMTPTLLEAFRRLLALLDEPQAAPVLAPLYLREIHYRLLAGDQAARLWQIASVGSQGHRIGTAIDWLKVNYTKVMRVEELASRVHMSPSNFHRSFKQLTAMSPLQYQKWLRLNEAKRLMLSDSLDASSAAFRVGYESASQFNREYRRLFGAAPRRDVEQHRLAVR